MALIMRIIEFLGTPNQNQAIELIIRITGIIGIPLAIGEGPDEEKWRR